MAKLKDNGLQEDQHGPIDAGRRLMAGAGLLAVQPGGRTASLADAATYAPPWSSTEPPPEPAPVYGAT